MTTAQLILTILRWYTVTVALCFAVHGITVWLAIAHIGTGCSPMVHSLRYLYVERWAERINGAVLLHRRSGIRTERQQSLGRWITIDDETTTVMAKAVTRQRLKQH